MARILDIGCGVGHRVKRDGNEWVGLDISPQELATARRAHPYAEFIEGDAQVLPFGAADFDRVQVYHLAEHLPDPRAMLREAHRVLKPGGIFEIEYPNGFGIEERFNRLAGRLEHAPGWDWTRYDHAHRFAPADMRRDLREAGFAIEHEEGHHFLYAGAQTALVTAWRAIPPVESKRAADAVHDFTAKLTRTPLMKALYLADKVLLKVFPEQACVWRFSCRKPG